MPALCLRDYRPADFDALYRIDQNCFEPNIAYSRRQLRGFLSLSTARCIVAESGGRVVGFVVGYLSVRRIGRVVTLDVLEGSRREGIGRELLSELARQFEAEGVVEVRLEVDSGNEAAIAFYERLGFLKQRRLADYYGPGRHAWEMGKDF